MTTYFISLAFHPYYEQLFNAHPCAFIFFYSLQNEFSWAFGNVTCFPDGVDGVRQEGSLYSTVCPHDLDCISNACVEKSQTSALNLGGIT